MAMSETLRDAPRPREDAKSRRTPSVGHPTGKSSFRPDIEGLRAVSIVTVVLFHAARKLMPGGFVGVDVFFVISGYLISGIIARELREERFTLVSFYERRIRRIFPALVFMLVGSAMMAYAVLPPLAAAEFGRTIAATTLFVSNIQFWALSGYFWGPAATKPLLHTWSLAVEEQFYIVFPILLIGLWRFFRRGLIGVIALCAAVSLAANVWTIAAGRTGAAFYLAPLRAYELLAGALLALGRWPRLSTRWLRETLAALGLALILGSAEVFSAETPFPGASALMPCLGACLILYTGSVGGSLIGRLLSLRPVGFVGSVSYSLYLWHWPMLVFAKQLFFNELTPTLTAAAIAAAVVMAVVSRRFVERPFLHRRLKGPRAFVPAAAVMGGLAAAGALVGLADGLPQRFPAEALRLFAYAHDFNPYRKECQAEDTNIIAVDKSCRFGAPVPPTIAVWGDSHGAELAMALGEEAGRRGASVMQITWAGCAPSLDYETRERPACARHNLEVFDRLTHDPAITDVVIVAHYDLYSNWPRFMAGIVRSLHGLAAAGKRLTIVDPVPTLPFSAPQAAGLSAFWGRSPADLGIPRAKFAETHLRTMGLLDAEAAALRALRIVPAQVICDATVCHGFAERAALFFDDNHMSLTAARRLVAATPALASMWVK